MVDREPQYSVVQWVRLELSLELEPELTQTPCDNIKGSYLLKPEARSRGHWTPRSSILRASGSQAYWVDITIL